MYRTTCPLPPFRVSLVLAVGAHEGNINLSTVVLEGFVYVAKKKTMATNPKQPCAFVILRCNLPILRNAMNGTHTESVNVMSQIL